MPIYKYTIIKYLKSWSTWIIAIVSFLLIFGLAGALAFGQFHPSSVNAARSYTLLSIAIVAGITSFLAIFTSVFAGFKSASMFKDEVEDGTFLIILSKPVSRQKIIAYKWLALLTVLMSYTLFVALSFLITILIFDKGSQVANLSLVGIKIDTLRSSSPLISLIMWGILSVVALIFSSIALLLSTKLSVGATIGISVALGVIVPITSLVEVFTMKQEYAPITNNDFVALNAFGKKLGFDDKNLIDDQKSIYNVGFETGDIDAFKKASIADINFQIQYLASFASDRTIPEDAKTYIAQTNSSRNLPGVKTGTYSKAEKQGYFASNPTGNADAKLIALKKQLEDSLKYTWVNSWEMRNNFINTSAVLTSLLSVKKGFSPDFKSFKLPKDKEDDNAALKKGINQNLINGLNAAVTTGNIELVFKAISGLVISVEQTYPKTGTPTATNIKNQIYLTRLLKSVYTFVDKYFDDFEIANNMKTTTNKKISLLNDNDITASDALLSLMAVVLLSNPMETIDSISVHQFFTEQKMKTSPDSKYDPTKKLVTDIKSQEDAAIYLLQTGDANVLYKKMAILMDNGHKLKKITYKEYMNKNWLLIAYLIIAFGLVPFTYLFIRKQDYR